jgi:hypothetical protein
MACAPWPPPRPRAPGGGGRQRLPPRRVVVDVVGDHDLGLGKLHRLHMHDVADERDGPPLALDAEEAAARRVPGRRHGRDARCQFGDAAEGLDATQGEIGRQAQRGLLEVGLVAAVHALLVLPGQEEVDVALAHVHGGVRKPGLACVHQAATVVGMHVRQQDVADVCGLDAHALQPRHQLAAVAGAEEVTGAPVHQHQPAARVDQVGVDRTLHRVGALGGGQQRVDLAGGCAFQQPVQVLRHRAVGQCRDLEVAEPAAEVAGLRTDTRGLGGGGRRVLRQRGHGPGHERCRLGPCSTTCAASSTSPAAAPSRQ